MQISDFIEKFDPASRRKPMTKVRAKALIDSRMPREYTKTQCLVLRAIVDSIRSKGAKWQVFDLNGFDAICDTSATRLAERLHIHIDTFYRSVNYLELRGLLEIIRGRGRGRDCYRVHAESLQDIVLTRKLKRDRTAYQHEQYLKRKGKMHQTFSDAREITTPGVVCAHALEPCVKEQT